MGQRLKGTAPFRSSKTLTALRHERITAPWMLDGLALYVERAIGERRGAFRRQARLQFW